VGGELLRKISHTRTVPERIAKALADVDKEFWRTLESSLARLGVTGCWVSPEVRNFPATKTERRRLAALLAQRILDHQERGTPLLETPAESIRSGRNPFEDPIGRHFHSVGIRLTAKSTPAKVLTVTHDDLVCLVPELHDEVLPVITRKRMSHGDLASDLTLVVEVFEGHLGMESIRVARSRLSEDQHGFGSVYLARGDAGSGFEIARLY